MLIKGYISSFPLCYKVLFIKKQRNLYSFKFIYNIPAFFYDYFIHFIMFLYAMKCKAVIMVLKTLHTCLSAVVQCPSSLNDRSVADRWHTDWTLYDFIAMQSYQFTLMQFSEKFPSNFMFSARGSARPTFYRSNKTDLELLE